MFMTENAFIVNMKKGQNRMMITCMSTYVSTYV